MKTINEFKTVFDRAFKFYSPIGDEEIAKFLVKSIFQIMSQPNQSEAVSRLLISYIEPYMFKNDVRHLLALGQTYQLLWANYSQKEEDFKKAENYFLEAYRIGPNLPPVLYGLLDLYRMSRNDQKIKEFGEIILKYWPDDKEVAEIVGLIN
ncbi:MAG: hypothetical protein COU10_01985 [Candidatus Harrisonbacteria bacterium CG10_big_fil_rev_8_21_14_0_10_45_28]|uniref:Tetratricopeptide repeat protein n=1 Tax=Candidatus Harrisonbacteria bacterium CG10_big_fil_rev_8_21_14_0_10_45_28 TaxID=1974586 RepID=A0A2H0UNA4_9BACT|nr:MAG: hypothetical protein COU10_01985 [Candidatus Harrisonbacteria bacterium CG10_big_fil_rev_8_21_14_0_10_45_28]